MLKLIKEETDDEVLIHPTAKKHYEAMFNGVIGDIEESGKKPLVVLTAVYLDDGSVVFGRSSDGADYTEQLWLLEQFYYKHKQEILNEDDF